ncbi:hypothetical protein F4818DRAFT_398240 [Hypoxylon cercidicola]|nr:hypothetical protein F4818DRAFT_398240 [Hypoxylon cercidicola]
MPPKSSTTSSRGRGASSTAGRPSKSHAASKTQASSSSRARQQGRSPSHSPQVVPSDMSDLDPFGDDDRPRQQQQQQQQQRRREGGRKSQDTTMDIDEEQQQDSDEDEELKTIPPELLTHVLHQFFEKDGTKVSKDANAAVAKYMDIFVREAIARTVVEKEKGFLEVS